MIVVAIVGVVGLVVGVVAGGVVGFVGGSDRCFWTVYAVSVCFLVSLGSW